MASFFQNVLSLAYVRAPCAFQTVSGTLLFAKITQDVIFTSEISK